MPAKLKQFLPLLGVVGLVYAAHRYGSPVVKGAAYGVAGFVLINQIPVVRNGLYAQVLPQAAAAAA
jgi:hypothetical protein